MSAVDDVDPYVPTSDQPRKPEWTGHFWYVMRAFALQASSRFTPDGPEATALVSLFKNLWIGIPCLRCKRHYVDNFDADPYTTAHACCAALGLEWIQNLRAKIQAGIDAAAPPAAASAGAPASRGKPTVPRATFPNLDAPVSNHSPEALQRQARAIAAALRAKQANSEKGDCGCALKRSF
jgi:hypothetical protein